MLKGAQPADVSFYFLHWFTDLAGAEATPLGGAEKFVLKFPHAVLTSFLWSIPYLRHLTKRTETEVVETYLQARWRVIAPDQPVPDDAEAIACMRIAVMAQSDTRVMEARFVCVCLCTRSVSYSCRLVRARPDDNTCRHGWSLISRSRPWAGRQCVLTIISARRRVATCGAFLDSCSSEGSRLGCRHGGGTAAQTLSAKK